MVFIDFLLFSYMFLFNLHARTFFLNYFIIFFYGVIVVYGYIPENEHF